MSVSSRPKATKIISQRKAFYRQRIPDPSCARKESVDIYILVTSRMLQGCKSLKLATFQRLAKVSRKAASEGATVLHIRFYSLSNNSK